MKAMPSLYIGTSAFTAAGWEGSFYPEGTKPADFLRYYAQHFNSVEIDSTFYRIPSEATVQDWAKKTPDGFVFAAKATENGTEAARPRAPIRDILFGTRPLHV